MKSFCYCSMKLRTASSVTVLRYSNVVKLIFKIKFFFFIVIVVYCNVDQFDARW